MGVREKLSLVSPLSASGLLLTFGILQLVEVSPRSLSSSHHFHHLPLKTLFFLGQTFGVVGKPPHGMPTSHIEVLGSSPGCSTLFPTSC